MALALASWLYNSVALRVFSWLFSSMSLWFYAFNSWALRFSSVDQLIRSSMTVWPRGSMVLWFYNFSWIRKKYPGSLSFRSPCLLWLYDSVVPLLYGSMSEHILGSVVIWLHWSLVPRSYPQHLWLYMTVALKTCESITFSAS